MSADVEIRITVTGFPKTPKGRIFAAGAVADVLKDHGLLEEFDMTGERERDTSKEIVFATAGTISISQSYDSLPRLVKDLKSVAVEGVTIKFETRHDWGDGDERWVVEVLGAATP